MVPDRHVSQVHIQRAHEEVGDEEQEVPLVFDSNAVVDPRAVVVHQEDACLAAPAVVRPSRFDVVTDIAALRPEVLELRHCLLSVPKQSLYIRRQTIERCRLVIFKSLLDRFPAGAVLLSSSQLLDVAQVFRATWFKQHRKEVIVDDVVDENEANDTPYQSQLCSETLLQERGNYIHIRLEVKRDYTVQPSDQHQAEQVEAPSTDPRHAQLHHHVLNMILV